MNVLDFIARGIKMNLRLAGATYVAFCLFVQLALDVVGKMEQLVEELDGMAVPTFATIGLNVEPFGFVNYFVPLAECCAMFVAWMTLWLLCNAIRFVKAWIPTVS